MSGQPVAGEPGCGGERAGLLEQVGGSRNHDQVILAAQFRLGGTVEAEHCMVVAADDQQRGRPHQPQPRAGQVGAAATRHHGGDVRGGLGAAWPRPPVLAPK